jgi:hypothetical protein
VREKGPAPWDSKGPRLMPIGGIGINRVETSYLIMTVPDRRHTHETIFQNLRSSWHLIKEDEKLIDSLDRNAEEHSFKFPEFERARTRPTLNLPEPFFRRRRKDIF